MTPQKLTLEGFTGIYSGQGKPLIVLDLTHIPDAAQLVAITGPNGSGKTTIIDNLHPYRTMPSHSSTLGVGGFSYWNHINAPTARKELDWSHCGIFYRSILTFRLSGKSKKTDCYLLTQDTATGQWIPVTLASGVSSDGKSDTYDQCIESIMGPPEVFFTSDFAAQCRKPLSSYKHSEIKSLLASMLNLGHYQENAAKAALVGKLLKSKLADLQDELAQSRGAAAGIDTVQRDIREFETALSGRAQVEGQAQAKIDHAKQIVANLEAKRDAMAQDVEQGLFLQSEIQRAVNAAIASKSRLHEHYDREMAHVTENRKRDTTALSQAQAQQPGFIRDINRYAELISNADNINQACIAVVEQRKRQPEIEAQIDLLQKQLFDIRQAQIQLSKDEAVFAAIVSDGQAKNSIITRLTQTASLIDQVPCKGMGVQSTCPLLANAREAKDSIAPIQAEIQTKRASYSTVKLAIIENQKRVANADDLEKQLRQLHQSLKVVSAEIQRLTSLCAMAPALEEAKQRLPAIKANVAQFEALQLTHSKQLHLFKELEEKLTKDLNASIAVIDEQSNAVIDGLRHRLAKLAMPITESEIAAARALVQDAVKELEAQKVLTASYQAQRNEFCVQLEGYRAIQARTADTARKADIIGEEIAKWKLIEIGCGNNGLIALSIDDSGPEIAERCNSVLSECFGARFTVRFDTQRQTQSGTMSEDFDVRVWDNDRGDEKSLGDMSPGERVWVNASLANAIALYRADASGVQPETMFSDEADGPLDPERKRMFGNMKRAVLKLSKCKREYFITHASEVREIADYQIEVLAL